jgi:hypothetical protein
MSFSNSAGVAVPIPGDSLCCNCKQIQEVADVCARKESHGKSEKCDGRVYGEPFPLLQRHPNAAESTSTPDVIWKDVTAISKELE